MTNEQANKIFKEWQQYVEIADKLSIIFTVIPESFLPYPKEVLEEALNIKAKEYFDYGNTKMSKNIQETIASWIWNCESDEEALNKMKKDLELFLDNDILRKTILKNLQTSRDSWLKLK